MEYAGLIGSVALHRLVEQYPVGDSAVPTPTPGRHTGDGQRDPGCDSLSHCGAVVAILTITGLTHREAYKDVDVVTVTVPVISTLTVMAAAVIFY